MDYKALKTNSVVFLLLTMYMILGITSCSSDDESGSDIDKTEQTVAADIQYRLLSSGKVAAAYHPVSLAETPEGYIMELAMADNHCLNMLYVSKTEKGLCYLLSVAGKAITVTPYDMLSGSVGDDYMTLYEDNANWYMALCSRDKSTGRVVVNSTEKVVDESGEKSRRVAKAKADDDMNGARGVMLNFLSDFAEKLDTFKDVLEVSPVTKPAAFPLKVITSCIVPIAKLHLYEFSEDAAIDGAYDYTWNAVKAKIQKTITHGEEAMDQYWTILTYAYKYGYNAEISVEAMKSSLDTDDKDILLAFTRNVPSFMQYSQAATSSVIDGTTNIVMSVGSVDSFYANLSAKVDNYDLNSASAVLGAGYVLTTGSTEKNVDAEFYKSLGMISSVKVSNLKPSTKYSVYAYIRTTLTTYKSQTMTFTTKESDVEVLEPTDGQAVDLGLSVKWASYNVGAKSPEEYGNYYAWGCTEPQKYYNWLGYEYRDPKSDAKSQHYYLLLGENIAGTKYDVAHVKWGGKWVMPTIAQIKEMIDNTEALPLNYKGVDGTLMVSNKNGNAIFFPHSGSMLGENKNGVGEYSVIWSSECIMPDYNEAYCRAIRPGRYVWEYSGNYRVYGYSVRPVCKN